MNTAVLLLLASLTAAAAPATAPAAAQAEAPAAAAVAPASGRQDVWSLDEPAFIAAARRDVATLHDLAVGLEDLSARAAREPALSACKSKSVCTADQKRALLSGWGALFNYFTAIESLRQTYWDCLKLPPNDPRHLWGFVITHRALTALLANGLAFAAATGGDRQLETLLNEPNPEFGVPAGAFARFKARAIHVSTATQLGTGDAWAEKVLPLVGDKKVLEDVHAAWAWSFMKTDSRRARELLARQGIKLFAGNAKAILESGSARAIFPVQKSIAEWMGDTRVARTGRSLIGKAFMEEKILPMLQPGDVIIVRQNWFLSNLGLPGFWPHAELYVGTAGELGAALDADPEVQRWAAAQPEKVPAGGGLTALLARRYPQKWKAYSEGRDYQGHGPIRVIEAISEGVSFTSMEHAFGVDYLGALRPRLSRLEKARAIERAFGYQGRPYDFNFDFFSDATLVCTELVFKSYQPGPDMKGLSFDLVDVAGRRTLPANEIIRRFDADFDKPERQLDFVLFVDASEKQGQPFLSDAAALRASWKRVKWDVAQK